MKLNYVYTNNKINSMSYQTEINMILNINNREHTATTIDIKTKIIYLKLSYKKKETVND